MKKDMKSKDSNKMPKCDVIIPVFNAPDWVKLCVYALFANTPSEYIGKVYLMNDNSNDTTLDCLKNLKNKYPNYIELISNKRNLGLVKNTNKGMKLSSSKYVLLLNSDCLVSRNTIPKLIAHIQKDSKIGLISPVSNNAANVTLEMYDGFSYTQMDSLLEKKFSGMNFDACTIVGNCLMITRDCINKVGYLDEAYGMGYGEETDYQFKAMKQGFKAKIAIDTYVYHKKEASFGSSKEKEERVALNRELFFQRWGKEYGEEAKRYADADPIKYINQNITEKDKEIKVDTLFYLLSISQNAGGSHVVVDIVNSLVIRGFSSNILYRMIDGYCENMLFNPIPDNRIEEISIGKIVTTLWITTYMAKNIAEKKKIPIINFVQGYENYFENGLRYNSVALTHKIADYRLTISKYLNKKLMIGFGKDSDIVQNSVNLDLLLKENKNSSVRNITFVLRDYVMKGDFLLLDIIKRLDMEFSGLNINVVYMNERTQIPELFKNTINLIKGPISRLEMINLLKRTDIYVDASFNEGFGLLGLEAIACGAVPVVSNSFGNLEYMRNGKNGFVINEVNDIEKYLSKIKLLIDSPSLFKKMAKEGKKGIEKFDSDIAVEKYIKYFFDKRFVYKEKAYSRSELKLIMSMEKEVGVPVKESPKDERRILYRISKLIPKSVKNFIKPFVTYLYNMYDHSK